MTILLKAGILTASDRSSQGIREDRSGVLLKSLVEALPAEVAAYEIVPDDREILAARLIHFSDQLACDVIFTTGGTGLSPRDNTPEATRAVIEKEISGIPEAIRRQGLQKTKFAMLSRSVAGIRGRTLIINLPGSPSGVEEAFEILKPVLFHAVELIRGEVGDCQSLSYSSH